MQSKVATSATERKLVSPTVAVPVETMLDTSSPLPDESVALISHSLGVTHSGCTVSDIVFSIADIEANVECIVRYVYHNVVPSCAVYYRIKFGKCRRHLPAATGNAEGRRTQVSVAILLSSATCLFPLAKVPTTSLNISRCQPQAGHCVLRRLSGFGSWLWL